MSDMDLSEQLNEIEYSIWCEKLQENITFDSFVTEEDIEMFDLTTLASYLGISNKNIVDWFNNNIDILHMIDTILTDEHFEDDDLLSISENTIIKLEDNWFVNMNVLVEYLRTVNLPLMHEILVQVMFDKNTIEDEEDDDDEFDDDTDDDEDEDDDYSASE